MTSWRVSLENPHTGKRHTFSDLEKMFTFLEERTTEEGKEDAENET